jgi:twitching motility protein PilT
MKKTQRIGEQLISAGVLTESQLQQAFTVQREMGGSLGEVLVKLGFVASEDLLKALGQQQDVRYVNLAAEPIPPDVQNLVKFETVKTRKVLPIRLEGKKLVLGMADPSDVTALSEAQFQSGLGVEPVIISMNQLERALEFFNLNGYGSGTLRLAEEGEALGRLESDIFSLLRLLVSWRGQDLHLSAGAVPAIRIDNEMKRLGLPPLTPDLTEKMLSALLTPAQQKTFAETLELDFAYSIPDVGRFRCNIYRQRGTLAFTARYVTDRIPSARELGLPLSLHEYALRPQGLILLTGPNGHGKSTTLASFVEHINRSRKANIITIEDPIEYTYRHKLSNVNQREIGTDTHSFAAGLKHIFRQNPDVIVIGELRDPETFAIALTAAGTGHLVLGTMHSLNATSAVDRIIDMFPADQQNQVRTQLADSLLLVLSQRLLKRANGSGRVLALERLGNSHRVRNAIREGKAHQLRTLMQGRSEEFENLDESLATLVNTGKVRLDEAQKWADNPGYFNELVRVRAAAK